MFDIAYLESLLKSLRGLEEAVKDAKDLETLDGVAYRFQARYAEIKWAIRRTSEALDKMEGL